MKLLCSVFSSETSYWHRYWGAPISSVSMNVCVCGQQVWPEGWLGTEV